MFLLIILLLNIQKIFKTLLNMFVILVEDYVLHIKIVMHQNISKVPQCFKNGKLANHVLMCKSYQKYNLRKHLELALWDHIINNKLDMNFFKIKKCLITPSFTFAQFFQLQGCGQYGMHKNILNSNKLESCTKCITSNAIQ
jgi:hypothetical protein